MQKERLLSENDARWYVVLAVRGGGGVETQVLVHQCISCGYNHNVIWTLHPPTP